MRLQWYSDGSTRWMRSLLINYLENDDLVRVRTRLHRLVKSCFQTGLYQGMALTRAVKCFIFDLLFRLFPQPVQSCRSGPYRDGL